MPRKRPSPIVTRILDGPLASPSTSETPKSTTRKGGKRKASASGMVEKGSDQESKFDVTETAMQISPATETILDQDKLEQARSKMEARREAHKAIERKYRKIFGERLETLRHINPFCENPDLANDRNYYHAPRPAPSQDLQISTPLSTVLPTPNTPDILASPSYSPIRSAAAASGKGSRPKNKLDIIRSTYNYIIYLFSVIEHLNTTIIGMNGVVDFTLRDHGLWLHQTIGQLITEFDEALARQQEMMAILNRRGGGEGNYKTTSLLTVNNSKGREKDGGRRQSSSSLMLNVTVNSNLHKINSNL